MQKDPIQRFRQLMGISEQEFAEVENQAKEEIRKAVEFAENSPEPDVATILEGIYA